MSYILDALKKSEAERSRGIVPTLLSPQQTPFRSSVVVWVLLGALIVNACLFAAWMFWPAITPTQKNPAQRAVPAATTTSSSANSATASRTPMSAREPTDQSRAGEPAPAGEIQVSQLDAVPATRVDPPAQASSDDSTVPTFSFSTHVYASDRSMRAVTMNGKRFVEGDTISPGVMIKEITESGVVLDINGRIVPMDVLQDWR